MNSTAPSTLLTLGREPTPQRALQCMRQYADEHAIKEAGTEAGTPSKSSVHLPSSGTSSTVAPELTHLSLPAIGTARYDRHYNTRLVSDKTSQKKTRAST